MMIFALSPEETITTLHDLARIICTRAGLVRPMIYVRKTKDDVKFLGGFVTAHYS